MPKRGRPPHPDILTPREWEVLALLRERLTNRQIAERLAISVHAARYHVSEILSKLGVGTREEAARLDVAGVAEAGKPRLRGDEARQGERRRGWRAAWAVAAKGTARGVGGARAGGVGG